jgi:hypothetical protein
MMKVTTEVLEGLFEGIKGQAGVEEIGMLELMDALSGSKRFENMALTSALPVLIGEFTMLQALLATVFVMGRNYQKGLDESKGLERMLGIEEG